MKLLIASGLAGLLFGTGLCLSEMVNPARVVGFLDVSGTWDPTLLWVMIGALVVAMLGFRLTLRRPKPLLAQEFQVVTRHEWDLPLFAGAGIFGVGWGLAGFCPGPALTALAGGGIAVWQFVLAMLAGMWLCEVTFRRNL